MKEKIMKKKTLVLGASLNPGRYSNIAIKRLTSNQQPTVAVGLRKGEVTGINITNEEEDFDDIHTITLYLNPQRQKQYYDYILSLEPKRVIFNPGTENPELFALLRKKNIEIEIACTLVMLATNQY
ncbi:CoA-binding protein [soil metagenome]